MPQCHWATMSRHPETTISDEADLIELIARALRLADRMGLVDTAIALDRARTSLLPSPSHEDVYRLCDEAEQDGL